MTSSVARTFACASLGLAVSLASPLAHADASGSGPAFADREPAPAASRFRFAGHLVGGAGLFPDGAAPTTGIGLQLGAQLDDRFGVIYAGTAGAFIATRHGAVLPFNGAYVYNAAMVDVTLARVIQLGAGPSLDVVDLPSALSRNGESRSLDGVVLGAQTRVGIALTNRRRDPAPLPRFMIGAEAHASFFRGAVPVTTLLTVGGGFF